MRETGGRARTNVRLRVTVNTLEQQGVRHRFSLVVAGGKGAPAHESILPSSGVRPADEREQTTFASMSPSTRVTYLWRRHPRGGILLHLCVCCPTAPAASSQLRNPAPIPCMVLCVCWGIISIITSFARLHVARRADERGNTPPRRRQHASACA